MSLDLPKYPSKAEILQLPHHMRKGAYKKLRKYKKRLAKVRLRARLKEQRKHGT